MGKKGHLRMHLPWLLKLSYVDGSVYRYFYSNILFPFFPLCLMGSLLNINSELFYFIAATELHLIRSERKKESLWSLHSVPPRKAHHQSFRALKFFFTLLCCHMWKIFQVPYFLAYFSPFLEVHFLWVVAMKWVQTWE